MGALNRETPKLSVCMITYNHEQFISQAIESVLDQKTNFEVELVIGEDCSKDKTREILKTYEEKKSNTIRLVLHGSNVGAKVNFIHTYKECKGTYVAFLEGDDYWTDPLKLQKQVDYLDAHPAYSLCSCRHRRYDESNKAWEQYIPKEYLGCETSGRDFKAENFLHLWRLTQPATIVLRKNAFDISVAEKYKYFRDIHLIYHSLCNGNGHCLNFMGAVYRQHANGIFSGLNLIKKKEISVLVFREIYYNNKKAESIKKCYLASYADYLNLMIRLSLKPFSNETTIFHVWKLFIESMSLRRLLKMFAKIAWFRLHNTIVRELPLWLKINR